MCTQNATKWSVEQTGEILFDGCVMAAKLSVMNIFRWLTLLYLNWKLMYACRFDHSALQYIVILQCIIMDWDNYYTMPLCWCGRLKLQYIVILHCMDWDIIPFDSIVFLYKHVCCNEAYVHLEFAALCVLSSLSSFHLVIVCVLQFWTYWCGPWVKFCMCVYYISA